MEGYPFTMIVVVSTIAVSYFAWQRPELLEKLLLDVRAMLGSGQGYRAVTSGWVHADWAHLAFNMFSLWSFGSILEQVYGPAAMLGPHLAGIIGGSVLATVLHKNENYRALGASGGVCGVIFASVILLPGGSVYLFFVPIPIPAEIYAFAFLILTWLGMRRGTGRIGHDAHFGGAIIGILTATLLFPEQAFAELPMLLAILGLSAVLFWVTYREKKGRARTPRTPRY